MEANLSNFERTIRFILAVIMLAWAIAGGPVWAYAAIILLATASWGHCPLHSFLKK